MFSALKVADRGMITLSGLGQSKRDEFILVALAAYISELSLTQVAGSGVKWQQSSKRTNISFDV